MSRVRFLPGVLPRDWNAMIVERVERGHHLLLQMEENSLATFCETCAGEGEFKPLHHLEFNDDNMDSQVSEITFLALDHAHENPLD